MYTCLYKSINKYHCDISVCQYYKECVKEDDVILITDLFDNKKACEALFNEQICGFYSWNKLFKKNLFNGIEYPEYKRYEDMFTVYKLFIKAKKVVFTNEKLYHYRQHDSQLTNPDNEDLEVLKNLLKAWDEILSNDKISKLNNSTIYPPFLNVLINCKNSAINSNNKKYKDSIWQVNNLIKKYCTKLDSVCPLKQVLH